MKTIKTSIRIIKKKEWLNNIDNRITQQADLVDIIISLFEVIERRGLFELEKYLYIASKFDYLVKVLEMVSSGTDPQDVLKYLTELVDSENDPDIKLLKKMIEQSVPQIQIGAGTAFSIKYRLFALTPPEVEHYYTMKCLEFEKKKARFYQDSILFNLNPELVSTIETIFFFRKIAGFPVDFSPVEYNTIAIALLGCSRSMQVKIFEYFPDIEAERFLNFYKPEKISETDVINAMHEIEEWEKKQKVLRQKIVEWQHKQSLVE